MPTNPRALVRSIVCLMMFVMAGLGAGTAAPASGDTGPPIWRSDLGNGRYQNPILHADYSDPDVIRVGAMFYMTASSFNKVPGLPLLQSRDMVNWELVGHALPALVPAEIFDQVQVGKGVWAPCLRFHDGKFWIFYPDPDAGIYVITATQFAGPWSAPHLLLPGLGIIDPTPLWDVDGKAYLLHAWAKSRAGFNNVLTLRQMSADARQILPTAPVNVIDGNQLPGYKTLEGPKFYQAQGYYYIFAPAGGVETGWQSVFRARQITGPYEDKIVMHQGSSTINGPHQGAWVQTAAGEDWFFHFQDKRAYGRVVHLQPMQWRDGWPLIGEASAQAGTGQPVLSHLKPSVGDFPFSAPPASDAFTSERLGLQWQWNANPRADWYSLTARRGHLRLFGQTYPAQNLPAAAAILTQKLPAESFSVETRLELHATASGDQAGLILQGQNSAWLGVRRTDEKLQLVLASCTSKITGCEEQLQIIATLDADEIHESVGLRMQMESGGITTFSYQRKGQEWVSLGASFRATMGRWVGAQMGIFCLRLAPQSTLQRSATYVDVEYFRVRP